MRAFAFDQRASYRSNRVLSPTLPRHLLPTCGQKASGGLLRLARTMAGGSGKREGPAVNLTPE